MKKLFRFWLFFISITLFSISLTGLINLGISRDLIKYTQAISDMLDIFEFTFLLSLLLTIFTTATMCVNKAFSK